MSDTRDRRAIEQIACPHCGAAKGKACYFRARDRRPACHTERRTANQERTRELSLTCASTTVDNPS